MRFVQAQVHSVTRCGQQVMQQSLQPLLQQVLIKMTCGNGWLTLPAGGGVVPAVAVLSELR